MPTKIKPAKKKASYTENYKSGLYYHDRDKCAGWADDDDVWLNIKNAGCNDDGTEFVTITFNNINPDKDYGQRFRDKINPKKKAKT